MFFLYLVAAAMLQAQAPPAQDWQKVTDLPALDSSGLSPAQKANLLKVLREENCICGCSMKIAECRIKDPGCNDSRTLSSIAAQDIKAGKNATQVRASLKDSDLAKARRANLMGEPVALSIEGAPSIGPADARVTIVEFSDFQCPFCRTAAKNVLAVVQMFPKDVRLVFKQFPLEEHSQAAMAAEAGLAAHAQGKFWELHDKMFGEPRLISKAKVTEWAKEIGLDMARFSGDLNSGKYRKRVTQEVQEGVTVGVQGTPTFFVNSRYYRGQMTPEDMKPVIEEALKKQLNAARR